MPILPAEPSIHPPDLPDRSEGQSAGHSDAPNWWVFRTRARQEKCLARELLARGISFYLPLVPRRLLVRGRRVHSHVPLFTGYVFVLATDEERLRALSTKRVAQTLQARDDDRLQSELRTVKTLIDSGAPLTVESRLQANQPVRIRSGALAGLEGTVATRKNRTRLIVWVTMLQQGVSVEIDDCLLEPTD